jgi:hypothetical protein
MAKVKVHVWHSVTGEIVAVGRQTGKSPCIPMGGMTGGVTELEVDETEIRELHQTHVVDVGRKALVKLARQ